MPDRRAPQAAERTFTGVHMLLLMGAFFGVIIGVNVAMAVSATSTWTGLVVQNSYVASQEFNAKQQAWREQQSLGWQSTLAYEDGRARFSLIDGDGRPVRLDQVEIQLNRPIGTKGDRRLHLTEDATGAYAAAVELQSGVWEATISSAPTEHGPFEFHTRIIVPTNS